MYYQVPSKPQRTEKPKPIFPWEEHAPKPTRVFPEEQPPSPEPEPEPEPVGAPRTSSDASQSSEITRESRSSSSSLSDKDPWNTYTRTNAWDAMPEIDRYVQAFAQARKGKIQLLHQTAPSETADQPLSPLTADADRRPSMRVTDFPTEVERPSLPVTPAPRHPSFWGEERDEAGELPAAEGVPKQEDWVSCFPSYPQPEFALAASASRSPPSRILCSRCQYCGKQNPVQKLEELQRKQSEVLQTGPQLQTKDLPQREMPASAVDTTAVTAATTARELTPTKPKSILKEPSFELGGPSGGETSSASKDVAPEVLSPDVSTSP
jgi:hypothetical protein